MKLEQPIRIPIRLTQKFRANSKVYKKFGLAGHDGLDYGCPTGTKLFAPMAGKVYVGWAPKTWGLFYSIENDWGTVYLCHLKENYMSTGSKVMKEQLMGETNNTGFSTGPHLHIGLRVKGVKDAAMKDFVDPLPYFEPEPASCEAEKKEIRNLTSRLQTSETVRKEIGKSLKTIMAELQDKKKELGKSQSATTTANKTITEKEEEVKKLGRKVTKLNGNIEELTKERTDNKRRYEKVLERDVSKISYWKILLAILSREQEHIIETFNRFKKKQ